MFADAATGLLGFNAMADMNPLRWSGSLTFEKALADLEDVAKQGARPIIVKIPSGILSIQERCESAQEAIEYIKGKRPMMPDENALVAEHLAEEPQKDMGTSPSMVMKKSSSSVEVPYIVALKKLRPETIRANIQAAEERMAVNEPDSSQVPVEEPAPIAAPAPPTPPEPIDLTPPVPPEAESVVALQSELASDLADDRAVTSAAVLESAAEVDATSESAGRAAAEAPDGAAALPLEPAPQRIEPQGRPVHDASPANRSGEFFLRLQILDGTSSERRVDLQIDSGGTVEDLKIRQFSHEIACGWRARCVYLGRQLGDSEPISQLPSGSFLQCYLQRTQSTDPSENEFFPAWARLSGSAGSSSMPPCPKWQDLLFHSAVAVGVAWGWAMYFADPLAFDAFGRFALFFFSVAWVVTCSADYIQHGRSTIAETPHTSFHGSAERDHASSN